MRYVPGFILAVLGLSLVACPGPSEEPDASLPDAADIDAKTPDATPRDGPAADLVLGQSDMGSATANAGGEGPSSLSGPTDVTSDGTSLWVADGQNARVLQWDTVPADNGAAADHVVGQEAPTAHTPGLSAILLGATSEGVARVRVFSDGDRLYVSDWFNNRVLIWNSIPAADGVPADLVLGQPDFSTREPGSAAEQMSSPGGVWSDGSTLIVADTGNSRVLIWSTFPTANGQSADIVLGRPDFGIGHGDPIAEPPDAASMHFPGDVFFGEGRLFVADTNNHRIMVWSDIPTANGAAADYFLGQVDGEHGSANAGLDSPSASSLDAPESIVVEGGALAVADRHNQRVVVYSPIPTESGQPANRAFGQPDLETGYEATTGTTPTADRLYVPRGVAIVDEKLYVADEGWNRVLRFDLGPP